VIEQRNHVIARLLPLLPAPSDESLDTGALAEHLQLRLDDQGRLLQRVLGRLADGGLLIRTRTGRYSSWRRSPDLQPLLATLPAPGAGAIAVTDLADRLGLTDATTSTALATLAWCGIAEHVTLADRPDLRYWRLTRTDHPGPQLRPPVLPASGTVVALIGSKRLQSCGRALADAVVDALVAAGIIHPGRHQAVELGQLDADTFTTGADRASGSADPFETVQAADLLIAATPTYQGTVSGLMKAFLDQLGPHALSGTVAIVGAVQTGIGWHSPAASALTSVLAEMGAHLPAPPLVVQGPQNPEQVAAGWVAVHGPAVTAALAAHQLAVTGQPAAAAKPACTTGTPHPADDRHVAAS
jgi:FMN reductase